MTVLKQLFWGGLSNPFSIGSTKKPKNSPMSNIRKNNLKGTNDSNDPKKKENLKRIPDPSKKTPRENINSKDTLEETGLSGEVVEESKKKTGLNGETIEESKEETSSSGETIEEPKEKTDSSEDTIQKFKDTTSSDDELNDKQKEEKRKIFNEFRQMMMEYISSGKPLSQEKIDETLDMFKKTEEEKKEFKQEIEKQEEFVKFFSNLMPEMENNKNSFSASLSSYLKEKKKERLEKEDLYSSAFIFDISRVLYILFSNEEFGNRIIKMIEFIKEVDYEKVQKSFVNAYEESARKIRIEGIKDICFFLSSYVSESISNTKKVFIYGFFIKLFDAVTDSLSRPDDLAIFEKNIEKINFTSFESKNDEDFLREIADGILRASVLSIINEERVESINVFFGAIVEQVKNGEKVKNPVSPFSVVKKDIIEILPKTSKEEKTKTEKKAFVKSKKAKKS